MEGAQIRRIGFLALFAGLFILVARLFYPFLSILLWSGLIYVTLRKPYARLAKRSDGGDRGKTAKALTAGLFTLGVVALIVVPAAIVGTAVLRQSGELAGSIAKALEENPKLIDLSPDSALGGAIYGLSGGQADLSSLDLVAEAKRLLAEQRGRIIGLSGALLKDAAGLAVGLVFMAFTLYFFFVDGARLMTTFISAIPIEKSHTMVFLRKLRDSGKQLIVGYFLVALFQASMMFLVCLALGVKDSLVLAALTLLAAFIPMLGCAIVWVPTAIGIALGGDLPKAILFGLLCAVFVSTLDNFLRPVLLHERLHIHPLLIFLSILGGLQIFGFNGIIIGPFILMLFFSAIELYGRTYDSPEVPAYDKE